MEKSSIAKSKEVNEQITYGIDTLNDNQTVEISVRDFMFIYKSIEEFRRYFHQPQHYPFLDDIKTYLGNTEVGAFSIIDKLYLKILDKYLPTDIENTMGSQDDKLTHPKPPYYYNLNSKDISRLTAAGNTETKAFEVLQEIGYEIYKSKQDWIAKSYNAELIAENPLSLLGLEALLRKSGSEITVADESIDHFISLDNKE